MKNLETITKFDFGQILDFYFKAMRCVLTNIPFNQVNLSSTAF